MYGRYFFNPPAVIDYVCDQLTRRHPVDDNRCEVVFYLDEEDQPFVMDLITFYPLKLKEYRIITKDVFLSLKALYGETIALMQEFGVGREAGSQTIRGKITNNARSTARLRNLPFNIQAEDLILPRYCPYLLTPIAYGCCEQQDDGPSIDRIDPKLGYVKGNVQVISYLANRMKNNASPEQLVTFAQQILLKAKGGWDTSILRVA